MIREEQLLVANISGLVIMILVTTATVLSIQCTNATDCVVGIRRLGRGGGAMQQAASMLSHMSMLCLN